MSSVGGELRSSEEEERKKNELLSPYAHAVLGVLRLFCLSLQLCVCHRGLLGRMPVGGGGGVGGGGLVLACVLRVPVSAGLPLWLGGVQGGHGNQSTILVIAVHLIEVFVQSLSLEAPSLPVLVAVSTDQEGCQQQACDDQGDQDTRGMLPPVRCGSHEPKLILHIFIVKVGGHVFGVFCDFGAADENVLGPGLLIDGNTALTIIVAQFMFHIKDRLYEFFTSGFFFQFQLYSIFVLYVFLTHAVDQRW